MTLFAFIDESGDHGMANIDPAYPMFALTAAVYDREDYISKEVPSLARLKVAWWGHEGVVFHATSIKKKLGPFALCQDSHYRDMLRESLCDLFARSPVKLISAVIDKTKHHAQYVDPVHPYKLAVQFILERISLMDPGNILVIFESRGRKEDAELKVWAEQIAGGENYRNVKLKMSFQFARKKDNVAGLQMADLACQPIIHLVQNPGSERPDCLAVTQRIRSNASGKIDGWGLKTFP